MKSTKRKNDSIQDADKIAPKLVLSAPVKSLCNKVALERTRPAQWNEANQLRRQAIDMLGSGQSDGAVIAWLQALLGDALQAHARR